MTLEEIKKFRDSIIKINSQDSNGPGWIETMFGTVSYFTQKNNKKSARVGGFLFYIGSVKIE